jgi:preprotein translocase subunit YajC
MQSSLMSMLPLVLMFVVLYFVMIRPQMKKQKEHRAMIEALAKGDEVVTAGGLLGKVTKLGDGYISAEIANGVEVQLQRSAVVQVCPREPSSKQAAPGCLNPVIRQLPAKSAIMNRYPVWKYAIIVIALVVGALYTLPNFFGEAPAVQVSAGKATARVDTGRRRGSRRQSRAPA